MASSVNVDATRETARSSLAPSSDATAFTSAQVVSTPATELPPPIFTMANNDEEDDNAGSSNSNGNGDAGGGLTRSTSVSLQKKKTTAQQQRGLANAAAGYLHDPICFPSSFTETGAAQNEAKMVLELADGTAFQGFSFGAQGKSISGECVFQTGEFTCTQPVLSQPPPVHLPPCT